MLVKSRWSEVVRRGCWERGRGMRQLLYQPSSSSLSCSSSPTTSSNRNHCYSSYPTSSSSSSTQKQLQQQDEEHSDWGRPKEILFQTKLANCVKLIGYVDHHVQLLRLSSSSSSPSISSPLGLHPNNNNNNNLWAASTHLLLLPHNDKSHPPLSIPVLFLGDLAQVAASHLKAGDHVYVNGTLGATPPHLFHALPHHTPPPQVQVMVSRFNFVKRPSHVNNTSSLPHQGEAVNDIAYADQLWNNLLLKPEEWWDDNTISSAFERKTDGQLLRIDDSTPKWVLQKLETITFDQKTTVEGDKKSLKNDEDCTTNPWIDLLANPKHWWDYRSIKRSGLVKQKHPDFKHKNGSFSLWLAGAPGWVWSGLQTVEFDVKEQAKREFDGKEQAKREFDGKEQAKRRRGDEFWKAFVGELDKWWDNRFNKKNPKGPDFKHKETGEAVWLNDFPTWVLSELPPPKTNQHSLAASRDKQRS
ncbi:hypothetical protein Tsubulata_024465 [Turnera subulata]|uniref:Uncharacterized protein n=1 Tax=Turnera subulata TaxID=218843 RepID=A0A9Q0J2F1_9ROSI|nr:hypothetical protein Tsubulata_024465 [Turnera subulata]